jgi:hypothetical protein
MHNRGQWIKVAVLFTVKGLELQEIPDALTAAG